MKLAKKFFWPASSKSNSGKLVYRCAATEVGRVNGKVVDSLSEFNETEFKEYDPTPYDGGFDMALTYGEPLPPSDAICYPRSPHDPNSRNLEEFSYGSVIVPYGQEPVEVDHEKPRNGSGSIRSDVEEKAPNGQELVPIDHKQPQNVSGLTNSHEEEKPSSDGNGNWAINPVPSYGCDFWGVDIFSYGNGYGGGDYEKSMVPYQGEEENHDYEYGMQEPLPEHDWLQPHDDLFGGWFWPARDEGDSSNSRDAYKTQNGDQWNGTADYIFGFSYPYGEVNNDNLSYGNPIYAYEKHSHTQPHHVLVEYHEPLWTPKPTYFQDYEEEVHNQTDYVSLYERQSYAQPLYGHGEYSETSWFQKPDYYEAYQEEGYPGPKCDDESYKEGGEELYFSY